MSAMIVPAWIAVIRNLPWRWIGAGAAVPALIVSIRLYGATQYKAGKVAEAARWEVAQASARSAAIARAQRQQETVNDAERRDTASRVEIRERLVPIREEIVRYVEANPDRNDCVDPVVRLHIDKSIATANAIAGSASTGD